MLLIMTDTVHEALIAPTSGDGGPLYGRSIDEGDVIQVRGLNPADGRYLGCWSKVAAGWQPEDAPVCPPATADDGVLVLIDAARPHDLQVYQAHERRWTPIRGEVIRPHTDFALRMHGLFETQALARRRVAIVGVGSGGSLIASALARCGVGAMRLVDHDRLAVHNIARHACRLNDVGRYKTRAMRDLLTEISPFIQVETFETDILSDAAALETIVDGCNVVVAATDNEPSKQAINRVCWPRGIPTIYGAAYSRGLGGEVFCARPPDGACYNCLVTHTADFFAEPQVATDFAPGYADPAKMAELVAAPGLGIDVGVIALLAARAALLAMLRGTPTVLSDLPTNLVMFGNRAEWIFKQPLESIFCDVPPLPDCPICRPDEYASSRLGLPIEESRDKAQKILKALPGLPDVMATSGAVADAQA